MTVTCKEYSIVLWQEGKDGELAPSALLIEPYTDIISITQDGKDIDISYESIDELCRELKRLKRDRK